MKCRQPEAGCESQGKASNARDVARVQVRKNKKAPQPQDRGAPLSETAERAYFTTKTTALRAGIVKVPLAAL